MAAMNSEAARAEAIGMAAYADELANSRYARALRAKDGEAWRQFMAQLSGHSARGMAMTLRGILAKRPSLWQLEPELSKISQPTLLIIGDEDEPCIEPNLFLKRTLPDCALAMLPCTGHLPNLEEPRHFNESLDRFFAAVSDGSWNRLRTAMR